MILDDIQNFINEYHIIGIGIGCFVTAAAITLLLKTVFGSYAASRIRMSVALSYEYFFSLKTFGSGDVLETEQGGQKLEA